MYKQLTSEQRYTISVLLRQNLSKKEIATAINVHVRTLYREVKRNSSPYTGKYGYTVAQRIADKRKLRYQRPRKLTPNVRATIIGYLKKDWSPKQISGRLKRSGRPTVSHETIYEMIRRDKARDGNLYRHCRFSMKHVNHWLKRKGIARPDNRKGIDQRPPEADGKRFGDWEADTIVGPKRSGALTLIERITNKIIIRKLPPNYKATHVRQAIIEALLPYKTHVLTITTDNGPEFACYEDIERELECQVYYARPYAPWQKGAVENANMLIRQYIPKRFNISQMSVQYITHVQKRINERPREKLMFRTPEFVFNKKIM
jgi:transposase, IS30 family (fragment)